MRVEMRRRGEADREGAGDMSGGPGERREVRVRPVLGVPEIGDGDPLGS